MTTIARTERGLFYWLSWWGWPFLWILLIPTMTMPLQVWLLGNSGGWPSARVYANCVLAHGRMLEPGVFVDNRWKCQAEDVLPSLLPGLLNLAPSLWLLSSRRRARYAAVIAGGLGALRVAVPALIYITLGTVTLRTTFWPGPDASAVASVALWATSLMVALVFPALVKAERR